MKKVLIATGFAVLAFATVAGAQGYMFSTNLTVGSTGPDVSSLQTVLMNAGYNIPAIASGAAAKGYFGSQTKAAVMAYQAARGIPNTGFVGPLTRAALNGGAPASGNVSCPAGYSCSPTAPVTVVCPVGYVCTPVGSTTGGTVTGGGITTPGVEGTLSATQSNAGLVSTAYEAQSMVAILGVKLEAKNSDIAIQRVKLDLGTETKIYNKIYSKIYVTDGTNVLASSDLNSSTVVKDGTTYYITLAGFNYIVPKNGTKTLVIKADVRPSIDSADQTSYTVRFAADGVRGVDGAGIDQYAAGTSITRSVTISGDLAEDATLKLSQNSSATPKKTDVVAAAGSNEDELDKLTLLAFDVKAEKDAVKLTDIIIKVAKTGSGAATASSTVYLFEGATEIDSASVTGTDSFVFSDFDQTIAKDSTRTFVVKADIRNADATLASFTATASSTGTSLVGENSNGDSVTESGSATGNAIGVRNQGAEITLVSKSITTDGSPQSSGANNIATSTLSASFVFKVKAVGGDITLGTSASTTPFFASTTPATIGTKSFRLYRNGAESTEGSYATSTSFTIPSTCSTAGLTNSCTLSEGNEVIVPVTVSFLGRQFTQPFTSGLYSVGIRALNWSNGGTTYSAATFMDGELEWITPEVSFP